MTTSYLQVPSTCVQHQPQPQAPRPLLQECGVNCHPLVLRCGIREPMEAGATRGIKEYSRDKTEMNVPLFCLPPPDKSLAVSVYEHNITIICPKFWTNQKFETRFPADCGRIRASGFDMVSALLHEYTHFDHPRYPRTLDVRIDTNKSAYGYKNVLELEKTMPGYGSRNADSYQVWVALVWAGCSEV